MATPAQPGNTERSAAKRALQLAGSALFVVAFVSSCVASWGDPKPNKATSSVEASPSASATRSVASVKESTLWDAAPTDGVWPGGTHGPKVGLGQWVQMGTRDYAYMVAGPPTLTTFDGVNVRVSNPVRVRKETAREDHLGWDRIFFTPGIYKSSHDEVYGTSKLKCAKVPDTAGQEVECVAEFIAPADEVPNYYWSDGRTHLAAWPSQLTAP